MVPDNDIDAFQISAEIVQLLLLGCFDVFLGFLAGF
jgi:hypothetical protein